MKQTCLYLWYPLFQAQWERCDQDNTLVKVDNLYSLKLKDRLASFRFTK
jgi:hypothetical protein